MKIRLNYVSNSSSSSFVCDVCGRTEIVYDATARDVYMVQCENGHVFCEKHEIKFEHTPDTFKEYLKRNLYTNFMTDETLKKFEEFYSTDFDNIEDMYNFQNMQIESYYNDCVADVGEDYHCCPICTFHNIKGDDTLKYLFKKYNINEQELLDELKSNFASYDDYKDYIKG